MDRRHKILVVDGSRVVRATLRKHLSDTYCVVEESDGESAWQTLMLDAGIRAVIAGIHPPRLDARDLLSRLRASSKRPLHTLPFLMIVSDVENHEARENDLAAGVAGFITKSMKKAGIIEQLTKAIEPASPYAPAVPCILEHTLFKKRITGLDCRSNHSALLFALDERSSLLSRFGPNTLARLDTRLSELIAARLQDKDLLGHWQAGQLAVIAPGVESQEGARFARQICKSLAQGQITVRGETVTLTLSVGIANSVADRCENAQDLLVLSEKRLASALASGGNTVNDAALSRAPASELDPDAQDWLTLTNGLGQDPDRASIMRLAPSILPLLTVLDRELELGLPLAEIDRRLRQYAPSVD